MSGAVPGETVAVVLDHALAQAPRLGHGWLVCVDGPTGSGKSTLANAVATLAETRGLTAHVLHVDDLLDGWRGLSELGGRLLAQVVEPLAAARPARYRRYDWETGAPAEEHLVAPMDLLVLDGCGSGHPGLAAYRASLVWVEADDHLRISRAIARDGEAIREPLMTWLADEAAYFAEHAVREHADLRLDEVGRLLP